MAHKALAIAAAALLVCSGVTNAQNMKGDTGTGTTAAMSADANASGAARTGRHGAARRSNGTRTGGDSSNASSATNTPATSTDPAQIKHARDGSLMNNAKGTATRSQSAASGTGK